MLFIIPAALLAVLMIAVFVVMGEVTWRHHAGVTIERSFRTSDEIASRSTASRSRSLAA